MIGSTTELMNYLGFPSSESSLAESLLRRANSILVSWIGRPLSHDSYTLDIESPGVNALYLPVIPVKSVTDAHVFDVSTSTTHLSFTELAPSVIEPETGLVSFQTQPPEGAPYILHVEYEAGYSETDTHYEELETAVYELAGILYRRRGSLDVMASTVIERTEVAPTQYLSPYLEGVVKKFQLLGPAKG